MTPALLQQAQYWPQATTIDWLKAASTFTMPDAGADVWLCPLKDAATFSSLLTADEAVRAQNFLPASKAQEFTAARAWLRTLLAFYVAETEPQAIRLGLAENGKPYLPDFPAVHFNLSHSGEFAAIAISRQPVGVDIEKLRPLPDWRELAEGLLPNITIEQIGSLEQAERAAAFLRHFTAREAYLKAVGGGFSESTTMLERDFHFIAMENQSYGPTVSLPEIPGYVGELCVLHP